MSFSVAPSGGGGKCAHEDKIEVRCSDGVSVSFGSTLIFALNFITVLCKWNYIQTIGRILLKNMNTKISKNPFSSFEALRMNPKTISRNRENCFGTS